MAFKRGVYIIILIVLAINVLAVSPVQPMSVTDDLIRQQHQETRQFCKAEWEEKERHLETRFIELKGELEQQQRENLWLDRILTFAILLIGYFLATTFRSWLDFKNKRKLNELRYAELKGQALDDDLGKVPKPIKDYGN
jgi:hypothetical protein